MIIKKKKLDKLTGMQQSAMSEQSEDMQGSAYSSDYDYDKSQGDNQFVQQDEYSDNYDYQDDSDYYSSGNDETQNQYVPENYQSDANTENVYYRDDYDENGESLPDLAPQPATQPVTQDATQYEESQNAENDDIKLFDLDNIDFSQRQERRRGDRRRGFRRVDDRNLVSRAREEADAIRESAMKEGYQAGLDKAQADIEEVKQAIAGFIGAKQEVFEQIAPNILDISVDIAKKIIKKEIEQGPEVLFNTVVDVLKTSLSKEETKVTLRVNPTEVNEIKQVIPEIINLAGIDTKIVVLADDEVTEGGCQVTTTNGIVDATIESRMRVVMQALREL